MQAYGDTSQGWFRTRELGKRILSLICVVDGPRRPPYEMDVFLNQH